MLLRFLVCCSTIVYWVQILLNVWAWFCCMLFVHRAGCVRNTKFLLLACLFQRKSGWCLRLRMEQIPIGAIAQWYAHCTLPTVFVLTVVLHHHLLTCHRAKQCLPVRHLSVIG